MAGNRRTLITGAVAGALLVAILAVLLGELVRELAHPTVVIAFALFGAILGAFALGAVAYDRERQSLEPTAGYREGVLAEQHDPDAEPEVAEPAPDGVIWLARRRAASLLKLPLTPWI